MKTSFLFVLITLIFSGGCSPSSQKIEHPELIDTCDYSNIKLKPIKWTYLNSINHKIDKTSKDDETEVLIRNLRFRR